MEQALSGRAGAAATTGGARAVRCARPRQVVRLMIGQSALPIAAGILGGWMLAWWGSRFLESFLFEVPARDPAMFLSGAVVLTAAGLVAAWLPARSAASLDPAITLRQE